MKNETQRAKHAFFNIIHWLSNRSVDNSIEADRLVDHFSQRFGRSQQTITKWLNEVSGIIKRKNGRIIVQQGVDMSGFYTIVRPTRTETAQNGHKSAIRGQRAHHGPRGRHTGQQ